MTPETWHVFWTQCIFVEVLLGWLSVLSTWSCCPCIGVSFIMFTSVSSQTKHAFCWTSSLCRDQGSKVSTKMTHRKHVKFKMEITVRNTSNTKLYMFGNEDRVKYNEHCIINTCINRLKRACGSIFLTTLLNFWNIFIVEKIDGFRIVYLYQD